MKEQFRTWNRKGHIKIKYSDEAGDDAYFLMGQKFLLNKMVELTESYMDKDMALSNRQLYYRLVAKGLIPNADKVYKRACKFLTDARYGGFIDWEAIEDRGRLTYLHAQWDTILGLIDNAIESYRLPRWEGQEYYIELFCEKQALEGVLSPVADKYHVRFGCNKGYSSASAMYDLSKRLADSVSEGYTPIVLYLGDHDPSGLDMVRDIESRVMEFTYGDCDMDCGFVVPVALTMEQIKKYNPPPNPAKITDPRAAKYVEEYGNVSWELDALEPEVLVELTENAIMEYIDIGMYDAVIKQEAKDAEVLREFAEERIEG